MTTKQDYYKILGVDRNASEREIKIAFKQLARKYHPDVAENKEEAEVKFKEINAAYSVLSDAEKRKMYDQFGHADMNGGGFPGGFSGGFSSDFGDFGDIFEAMFGMGGFSSRRDTGSRSRATRGRDLRRDVEIELEEAYRGIELDFDLEKYQTCPVCNGRRIKPGTNYKTCASCYGTGVQKKSQNTMFGQFITTTTCPHCNGEGQFPEVKCEECHGQGRTISKEKISVKIPAGIDSGMQLRVPEKGEAGDFGGPSGDLYVFVFVKEHELFKRDGRDLWVEIPIGFADAALGSEKELETFDGKEKIKIPPGTQSEDVITLEGKGMPDIRGRRRGDLKVKFRVVTPTKLTDKQRKLLCEFAEDGPQFHCDKKGFLGKLFDAITGKGKN